MRVPQVAASAVLALSLLVSCGEEAGAPWCQQSGPLELSCPGPHCVAALAIDYKRLEPRGYRVFALEGEPLAGNDEQEKQAKALELATARLKQLDAAAQPDQSEARRVKGLHFYTVYFRDDESGDSWQAILHEPTSQVLFVGREEWANPDRRGYDFPLPEGFQGPEGLGCQRAFREPGEKMLITTGSPLGSEPPSTASQAWEVARHLNLTARLVGDRPYEVLVISYAPAVGELDPEAADWYVWIYRL